MKIVSDIIHVGSSDPILKIIILLIENGADPYIEDIYGSTALDEVLVQQIYSEHNILVSEVKKLQAKQRLAFAKMMIDPKHIDKPNDVIIKILKTLKIPPKLMSKSSNKKKINKLFYRSLQQELKNEIEQSLKKEMTEKVYKSLRKQFPGEKIDDMIEFYRKQLRKQLPKHIRKAYKRQKRTRKRKLGIRTGSSDQSSSRKSRTLNSNEELEMAIAMEQDLNENSSKSRSLRSSEEEKLAIWQSAQEFNRRSSGSKKKKLHKSKRKSKKSKKKSK